MRGGSLHVHAEGDDALALDCAFAGRGGFEAQARLRARGQALDDRAAGAGAGFLVGVHKGQNLPVRGQLRGKRAKQVRQHDQPRLHVRHARAVQTAVFPVEAFGLPKGEHGVHMPQKKQTAASLSKLCREKVAARKGNAVHVRPRRRKGRLNMAGERVQTRLVAGGRFKIDPFTQRFKHGASSYPPRRFAGRSGNSSIYLRACRRLVRRASKFHPAGR